MLNDTFTKGPSEKLAYGIDWSDFLGLTDIITGSVWTIPNETGELETVPSGDKTFDNTSTQIILDGGTLGDKYSCVNTIAINGADELVGERTIYLKIVNK